MRKIGIRLFGPTTVVLPEGSPEGSLEGSLVTDFGGIKPRQVLEMLALAVGTPVSKDRLVEQLWGEAAPRTATATLETYVSLLRRRLGVARGRGSALATTSNGYLLDPALVEVDLAVFRGLVRPVAGAAAEVVLADTERAVGLLAGELLAGEPYADWAAQERAVFAGVYVQACNRAAAAALQLGRPVVAVELARRAIGCEELSEGSWQLLIRGLSASGARSEALRAYLDLRHTLVEGLGTEPSGASRALYLDLLAEDRAASAQASGEHEVRTLLGLLRDALDGFPDLDRSLRQQRLSDPTQHLVGAA